MKLETFFEKFELFADAPGAVEKMRALILALAVQGKLVDQKASDEPAAILTSRIIEQQKRDSIDSGTRTSQPLPPISPEEVPCELPFGWVWERLGNIGNTNIGLTYSPENIGANGVPVLRSSNIQNGKIDLSDLVRVAVEPKDSVMADVGDLLICVRNGSRALIGKSALIDDLTEPTAFGAFMAIFRSSLNKYLYLFICSPLFRRVIAEVNTTTINQITQANLRSTLAPIPPLAEQKRIVAKVDELMALCDRLALQQEEREARHIALARASLARFAEAPTPENLQLLFHPAYAISPAEMRKTILALAVQGKLVAQDPEEGTVEAFLTQIQLSKSRLQSAGRIGKEKPVEPKTLESTPFEIPETWRWAKLGEITELITKGSSPKWQGIAYVSESEGVLFITSENVGNYNLRKLEDLKYVEKGFNEIEPRSILKKGDLLINLVGASIGRAAIYNLEDGANINQAVALIRLVRDSNGSYSSFILHYLNSSFAIDYMLSSRVVNAQPNISLTDTREFLIPIPPLAEQHRIVARVDELMTMVDKLESQLTSARTTSENLLTAAIAELTNG